MSNRTNNWHKHISLTNFTAFKECRLDFVPGINAFIGENGTGKTHVMKALYALQRAWTRLDLPHDGIPGILQDLYDLFQTKTWRDIVRIGTGDSASVKGNYGDADWEYTIQQGTSSTTILGGALKVERPVFIPAIDMIGHSKGFVEAYNEIHLDFDITCLDIVTLLRLERRNGHKNAQTMDSLTQLIDGEIEKDDDGRFYLATRTGRIPMPLVAEGLRKIATLIQIQRNGWLSPGTTLFWDEPEVNLNPVLMDELVQALIALARTGVQIFLATHSYVILKELDLQAKNNDSICYFAFQKDPNGTIVNSTDDFSQLKPNPILDQYDSLYDRELTRSTGRNRRGEHIG